MDISIGAKSFFGKGSLKPKLNLFSEIFGKEKKKSHVIPNFVLGIFR